MKASVTPNKVKSPVCGAGAKKIKDYECPNGHKFTDKISLYGFSAYSNINILCVFNKQKEI